jgi:hypothetical protein
MNIYRTEKGKNELQSKERQLSIRERGAVFLADGLKTVEDIQQFLGDDGSALKKLIAQGYLVSARQEGSAKAVADFASRRDETESQTPAPELKAVDEKRSLANAKKYLLGISELMFLRKTPHLADQYREQLLRASDRGSLSAVADVMVLNIAEMAGPERARSLRARIAQLLPIDVERA